MLVGTKGVVLLYFARQRLRCGRIGDKNLPKRPSHFEFEVALIPFRVVNPREQNQNLLLQSRLPAQEREFSIRASIAATHDGCERQMLLAEPLLGLNPSSRGFLLKRIVAFGLLHAFFRIGKTYQSAASWTLAALWGPCYLHSSFKRSSRGSFCWLAGWP